MAGKIFINYRRGDDPGFTHALYQRLEAEFPGGDLFMDVEGHIAPGDDFVEVLSRKVGECDVLLAVIGPRWADLMTARAGDKDDFVAIELQAALEQGKRVIPVLVGGAGMPRAELLPEAVRALARRNAVGLRPERFRVDCESLVGVLKEQLTAAARERTGRAAAERQAAEAARRQTDDAEALQLRAQAATAWSTVAASEDIEALQTFLRAWPGAEQATLARRRVTELRRRPGNYKRGAVQGVAALAGLGVLVAAALFVQWPAGWLHPTPPVSTGTSPPPPTLLPIAANTVWMLVSLLVTLIASIPGIALFYGGFGGAKDAGPQFTRVFSVFAVVGAVWAAYGYSLSFTEGGSWNGFLGGSAKLFLRGVTPDSMAETFTNGVVIPEHMYVYSQMTIACVATALVAGAMVGRMRFAAVMSFAVLWVTVVYVPICHMFWYWAGPSALAEAGKRLTAVSGVDVAAANAIMAAVTSDAGIAYRWGALDFAGGAVVYIAAGVGGLACWLIMPKRVASVDAGEGMSEGTTLVGALLLAIGWLGAIAGANLEANTTSIIAVVNVLPAAAAGALAWLAGERIGLGRAPPLGAMWGGIAGLVAITPAASYVGTLGSVVIGGAGAVASVGVRGLTARGGDAPRLTAFIVYVVAGTVGMLGAGIFVAPYLGGTGIFDYVTGKNGDYVMAAQVMAQAKAVGLAAAWSAVGSLLLLGLLHAIVGLWPDAEQAAPR